MSDTVCMCVHRAYAFTRITSTVITGAALGLVLAGALWATPLPPIFSMGPPPLPCTVFHSPNYIAPNSCERSDS